MYDKHLKGVDRLVLLLSFGAFASSTSVRICDPLLPIIASTFSVTTGEAASVITATNVGYGLSLLGIGPLGDKYSKYNLIALFCFACAIASLACGLSPTLDILVTARALTGVFTAALIPLSMAWIGDNVTFEQRQDTLAKYMSGQILGVVAGQTIGGLFADSFGWQNAFFFMALVYLSVSFLLISAKPIADRLLPQAIRVGTKRTTVQQSIRYLLTNQTPLVVLVTVFLESVGVFGSLAFVPTFLHSKFSLSLFFAGAVVATFGLGGLFYTVFSRRMLCLLSRPGLVLVGGALMSNGFLLICYCNHIIFSLLGCILVGLGFYMHHVTLQAEATQMLPEARGTAVALFASVFFIGQAAGVGIGAYVIDNLHIAWLFMFSSALLPIVAFVFSRFLAKSLAKQWDLN